MSAAARIPVAPDAVRAARALLLAVAATVAVVDLVDKAVAPKLPETYHPRPASVVVLMVVASVLGLVTFPRAGSRAIAVAGGLMVGGGIANTASLALWGAGIPNPLLSGQLQLAFNLADVCVVAGFALLVPATLLFAVKHRDALGARL